MPLASMPLAAAASLMSGHQPPLGASAETGALDGDADGDGSSGGAVCTIGR